MIVIKQPVPYDKRLNSKTGITKDILTFDTEVVNSRRLFQWLDNCYLLDLYVVAQS